MRLLDAVITMPGEKPEKPSLSLTLAGRLQELTTVWPWVEALAAAYGIPDTILFSVNLCLEEALSNIVRHGYGGGSSLPIHVEFVPEPPDRFEFVIEDQAPPFDPLKFSGDEETIVPEPSFDLEPGGHGIRLLRKFAGTLDYEQLKDGNRLTIGFRKTPRE